MWKGPKSEMMNTGLCKNSLIKESKRWSYWLACILPTERYTAEFPQLFCFEQLQNLENNKSGGNDDSFSCETFCFRLKPEAGWMEGLRSYISHGPLVDKGFPEKTFWLLCFHFEMLKMKLMYLLTVQRFSIEMQLNTQICFNGDIKMPWSTILI